MIKRHRNLKNRDRQMAQNWNAYIPIAEPFFCVHNFLKLQIQGHLRALASVSICPHMHIYSYFNEHNLKNKIICKNQFDNIIKTRVTPSDAI